MPQYHLYKSDFTDHRYFNIDERGGNITTARYVDRSPGEEYRVIVLVLVNGMATNEEMAIKVTRYNQHPPRLSLDQYSAEVVVTAEIGTPLLTVEAADDDEVEYNREIYYFLATPEAGAAVDPFLEAPSWSPVGVNRNTGELQVTGPLDLSASPLRLVVGAADGGSPQRFAFANLTVYVRNMSEPLDVTVNNTTETTIDVCWSPPAYGRPQGYVLTYTPTTAHKNYEKGSLNLTLDQLHSRVVIPGQDPKDLSQPDSQDDTALEIYRYCATVGGLVRWTEYIVAVRAWADGQVSMAASPIIATTRSDYCAVDICGEGVCTLQQAPPGYSCECHPGYYGLQCQHHNPCEPVNPCQHIGTCHNQTDGSYTCECLPGFYGQNCSRIDPCAAVSSNPCRNGGTCVRSEIQHFPDRQESGEYACQCPFGFFGGTCERHDPCSSSPCLHGSACTNMTDTAFTCNCTDGYTGETCEVDIDECSTSPCLNGGTCHDGVATFSCSCMPGYTGILCQAEIDECASSPCVRGNCVDNINDFECECPKGWGGKTCDVDLDECASSPCANGATCIDGLADFVCDCALGYSGKFCEVPESCPAQTTALDTGDFHWPATRHGGTVTLPCSYGLRGNFAEMPQDSLSTPSPVTTQSPSAEDSSASSEMSLEYEDYNISPTLVPESEEFTTQAEWQGGRFRISRRTRDVAVHAADFDIAPDALMKEDNPAVRRRIITSRLRGTSPRRTGRRLSRRRQKTPSEEEDAPGQPGQGIRLPKEEQGSEEPQRPRVRTRMRGFRLQKPPNPVAQPRIGERANSNFPRRGRQFLSPQVPGTQPRIGEAPELPRIGETLDEQPRIGTNRGAKESESPRIGENVPDSPRIGESASEHPRIGEAVSHAPRIGESVSTSQRVGDVSEYPRIGESVSTRGEKIPEQPRIGETLPDKVETSVPKFQSLGNDFRGHSGANRKTDDKLRSSHSVEEQSPMEIALEVTDPHASETEEDRTAGLPRAVPVFGSEIMKLPTASRKESRKTVVLKSHSNVGAVRTCVLLPNGTVAWQEPNTGMCRGKEAQAAENAARDIATLTASPASVSSAMFTRAANELAKLVEHALHDRAVANNMVSAISNMMEVNDSVVAEGDKSSNITQQLVKTINSFTESVPLEPGEKVEFRSSNLVVEARMLKSGTSEAVFFQPQIQAESTARRKRDTNSTTMNSQNESYLKLPPVVLDLAGTENVRLEFVSFSNDKFFRGSQLLGMPVITARITNTTVQNLTVPVTYSISEANTDPNQTNFKPSCVFWDEAAHDWSTRGMETVVVEGVTTCQATHLTAFSVLLDPMPASLGVHEQALSIITYIGLALSTAGLAATVATYALFRTLNRDRSGKIVMNLSLALLLLNCVFFTTAQVKPTSIACTALGAALHYLVLAAFAWMLVEAANMYQLLITVFASAETHFMAKRVIGAWGVPLLVVIAALVADYRVYQYEERDFCVINPKQNAIVYYAAYMGPICCVLAVNCVVFVMVTRVLCQRRPRSHKPHASSGSAGKEGPVTLAQVRGAVTVVALLGVTWVAGAVSVGWARLTLQYIFCITTPLQGLIIFVVRVAQHPEARAAWIALLTTGTLRRRPPATHTHSTHSSGHTHSTTSTPPRNHHSSARTISTRASPLNSVKKTSSSARNGSTKKSQSSSKNGSVYKCTSSPMDTGSKNSSMGTLLSRIVSRLNSSGMDSPVSARTDTGTVESTATTKTALQTLPTGRPQPTFNHQAYESEAFFSQALLEENYYHNNMNGHIQRPQSLVVLRADSHGVVNNQPPVVPQPYLGSQIPALLSPNQQLQNLLNAGVPPSMIPRRSLGSLMLLGEGKEGDDSSWHFVRPPPDGRSDPLESEIAFQERKHIDSEIQMSFSGGGGEGVENCRRRVTANESGCVVLAGQRVATKSSPILIPDESKGMNTFSALTRANSEMHMGSPAAGAPALRRTASVYMLGEWEDPRSSHA